MDTGSITDVGNDRANIFATNRTSFGDNPFLQLLVAEMQAQTPLDPVDNASFMNQMAQFSSMEQQKELNENMLALLQFQGALARLNGLSQGSALIGREVEYVVDEKGTTKKGIVEGLSVDEDGNVLVRIDGKDNPLSSIVGVSGAKDDAGKKDDTGDKTKQDA